MSNMLKTTVFLALLTGLFIAVGGLLGGRSGMIMAFVFALIMNFVSYWFSDKIVLKMYGAQPIGEAGTPGCAPDRAESGHAGQHPDAEALPASPRSLRTPSPRDATRSTPRWP